MTLSQGIFLHHIPAEKFTTNVLCLLIRRPLSREEVTQNALLPSLLSRGSAKYPGIRDIQLAAEALQGSIYDAQIIKKGEHQLLQFLLEYVDGDFSFKSKGLQLLRSILMEPRTERGGFYAPYFKGECENLKNRIEGRINNKSSYALLKCLEALCPEEPFGLYGDGYAEDLFALTPSGLFQHYKKILATSPIDFIALGKWDTEWLQAQLTENFTFFRDDLIHIPKAELRPALADKKPLHIDMGAAQGNLCLGFRGEIQPVGMDYIHFQLANEILGGGPNAKLFANVRERESLCYSIYSSIYRFKSLLVIQAGTAPDKMEHVQELALQEVGKLKKEHFSEEDLQNARQSLSKRWRALQDNPSGCIDFYASQYLLGDNATLDELLNMAAKASRQGIAQAVSALNLDTVVMLR